MILLGWVLWHFDHCWLYTPRTSLYIYILNIYDLVGWVLWNSTMVSCLMLYPLYTYILNICDYVWLGFMAYQPL